jgi:hypothetical protein
LHALVERRDAPSLHVDDAAPGTFVVSTPNLRNVTAQLTIFDVSGRRVAMIRVPSGIRLVWHGKDDSGRIVPAGIYLYRIDASPYRQEGKLVLVR